ncbi:prephenate dehydrogenase/arogenate dehydrogenase family protein [Thiobacillus sp.]|uniref:prephenate dehydrogenase n=1 Tax=Thiobacillus sp. TaxID=924 RepID=UPI00185030C0|nr:prephenate dehydrogenase/arogenate dehydrogenase family protein [Thiobacillus sp.]MBC2731684.1 prephenate dehydrogenase/arogenate dehydrogenase family protein [Thiobacillus sp.]MBC2740422.1 prephenate dehydrogenase/arogenate dehydrogenase family protein [Thiobacillus sp.]MBC2759169.1 prephenate dehydrogenase/arogenate dehydrogenase family protein [Thiobacillus sp.]
MIVDKLAIVGTGLIGGSFALALKQAGAVREVLGVGRNPARLTVARELGLIDRAVDWAEAGRADCILLAMPVGETEAVLKNLAPHLKAGAIVTDAGSTKADVVEAARAVLGTRFADFVPGHPIAGSEQSGPGAARADLYRGKRVVLTPQDETRADAVATVRALWEAAGAQVETLGAAQHDRIFAAVSHLPHLAAFALVDDLAQRADGDTFFRFAASGFRDFTRIAGSSPEMWRDIALANREAVLAELDAYLASLQALRSAVSAEDAEALLAIFSRAREARNHWMHTKP